MDERIPEPQPSGALVPPPRVPPGAVATAAPLPPRDPEPTRVRTPRTRRMPFASLIEAALDGLDRAGDRIASAFGLRE